MIVDVLMPRLTSKVVRAKVVEWLKKEGESVRKGEPIYVVETEKVTVEVSAPESGVLKRILAPVGTVGEARSKVAEIEKG